MRESLIERFPILELLQDSHDPGLASEAIEELRFSWKFGFPSSIPTSSWDLMADIFAAPSCSRYRNPSGF